MSDAILARKHRKVEINIIPLVDVLIVLIFFFLVSMQFRNITTLNIVPPEIETAGNNKLLEQIEIGISPEGFFFYNGEEVPQEAIPELLELAANTGSSDIPVVLLADAESYLKHVTFVMDACRKAGLENIRLQSR